MRGHARTAWDLIAATVAARQRNEQQFRTTFRAFVSTIVDETAHRLLMEYLRSTVKPRTMSVMEVARRVQVLCMYSEDLPTESGEPPRAVTDDEKKTLFYNMMPEEWKTTFTKGNLRIATMNIAQMAIYFNGLCSLEGGTRGRTGKKRKNNHGEQHYSRSNRQRGSSQQRSGNRRYFDRGNNYERGGGRGSTNSSGRGRSNYGGRGQGRGGGRGSQGSNHPHNNDICPVHGGHKWGECFLNPYGDNYRPRTGNSGNSNSQGRGNGSRRGDAYHANDGNNGRGNGSSDNDNNNNPSRGANGGVSGSDANHRRSNEHYLADIGSPEWN